MVARAEPVAGGLPWPRVTSIASGRARRTGEQTRKHDQRCVHPPPLAGSSIPHPLLRLAGSWLTLLLAVTTSSHDALLFRFDPALLARAHEATGMRVGG